MNELKYLERLDFHDAPINKLDIDFDNGSITFHVDILEDEHEDTTPMVLGFTGVSNMAIDIPSYPDLYEIEITSADFTTSSGSTHVSFIVNLGSGMPTGEISFAFKNHSITKL